VYQEIKSFFNNHTNKYLQLPTADKNIISNRNQHESKKNKKSKNIVKIKVFTPLEDSKDVQKLKVKGQIQSAVIDNVQEEFEKIGGYYKWKLYRTNR